MTRELPSTLQPPPDGQPWAPPLNESDVAVRLEMSGVTDAVAQAEYGFSDTWQMAAAYLPELQAIPAREKHEVHKSGFFGHYFRGLSFAFPLLLCAVTMAFFGFSLWGGTIEANEAAAVGLGTVLSFISTGGIIQTMARRSIFFASVREYRMSEASCWHWVVWGLISLVVSAGGLLAASAYFDLLPHPLNLIAVGFHICLGLLWLAAGILYTLERTVGIVVAAAAGIVWVVAAQKLTTLPLPISQMTGILVASGIAFGLSALLLRRRSKKDTNRSRPQRLALDLYLAWPYFVYGTVYYLFLFVDRLLAWTAATFGAPLSLQFRGHYETAVDIALFTFIFQVAWIHPAVVHFFNQLQATQKRFQAANAEEFNLRMTRNYNEALISFLPLALGITLATYSTAAAFGLLRDPVIHNTMLWASLGYICVVIGLFNASVLFRLSEPLGAVKPITIAAVVNLALGYMLSRLVSYDLAVLGFALGAGCFAALSIRQVRRRLQSLDYFYFASAS